VEFKKSLNSADVCFHSKPLNRSPLAQFAMLIFLLLLLANWLNTAGHLNAVSLVVLAVVAVVHNSRHIVVDVVVVRRLPSGAHQLNVHRLKHAGAQKFQLLFECLSILGAIQ
jgi:hypothetical protein